MSLIILDIDGTLTESMQADDVCFVRALAEAKASGKRHSASYALRPEHALSDAPHKSENWTQTS